MPYLVTIVLNNSLMKNQKLEVQVDREFNVLEECALINLKISFNSDNTSK